MRGECLPFLLAPCFKDYIWGGDRLKNEYGKHTDISPLAESWECSTHPDGECRAASGVFKGSSLRTVLRDHPYLIGTHPGSGTESPVLIKLIDSREDLSVQVHPDDEYAREHEGGQAGKTEMWYVLDAAPGASVVYGFYEDVTKEQLRRGIRDGSIVSLLRRVPVRRDDVLFVPPGMVHAIGKGCIIAEIQTASNLTYRLYDYDRTDAAGRRRELHVDKALDVSIMTAVSEPSQPMRVLRYSPGFATELLGRCRYFQVERILVSADETSPVRMATGHTSFAVFLCADGKGAAAGEDGELFGISRGDTFFVPADSDEFRLFGKLSLIKVTC